MPIGSNFDDFLNEEGLYKQTTAAALKKKYWLCKLKKALIPGN